jgi:PPM family protein phosphatase
MMRFISFSEAGGHRINEDALEVKPHRADPGCWLCCLADGQGGRAGRARAANLACTTAIAAAIHYRSTELIQASCWVSILQQADRAVTADPDAGFTTLVGLSICNGVVSGASCGDSAALVISGEQPRALTARQVKNPPVGSGAAPFVPFLAGLVAPWTVVVMSDGVWKYVGWEGVIQAAAQERGQRLLETLQSQARLPGSGRFQDDFTMAVFEGADSLFQ